MDRNSMPLNRAGSTTTLASILCALVWPVRRDVQAIRRAGIAMVLELGTWRLMAIPPVGWVLGVKLGLVKRGG
jgi:hypothetical protein